MKFTKLVGAENRVAVVVSAFANATDILQKLALSGEEEYIEQFLSLHGKWSSEISFEKEIEEMRNVLKSAWRFPGSAAYMDHILSFGERLSAKIFALALKNGEFVDAYNILSTNGDFGHAMVDLEKSRRKVRRIEKIWQMGKIPVITGFLGNYMGYRTTVGRNGSDYTASVLGVLLHAKNVLLMSDVDGIYTAEPKLVKDAKLIPLLSYERARSAARLGMRAIHPRAVETAYMRVPLSLGSTPLWKIGTVVGDVGMNMPMMVHSRVSGFYHISVIGRSELPLRYSVVERGKDYVTYKVPERNFQETMEEIHGVMLSEIC